MVKKKIIELVKKMSWMGLINLWLLEEKSAKLLETREEMSHWEETLADPIEPLNFWLFKFMDGEVGGL